MREDSRSRYIAIRVNEREKRQIDSQRQFHGFTAMTQYIRNLIFKDRAKILKENPNALTSLPSIDVNSDTNA